MKVFLLMCNTEEDTEVLAHTVGEDPIYSRLDEAVLKAHLANNQFNEPDEVHTIHGEVLPRFFVRELEVN
jgi:hypothetical protein